VATVVHAARALADAGFDADAAMFDEAHLEKVGALTRVAQWASVASG
jgi:hypothetical protein